MGSPVIQLLVLAGIAVFLILRLRSVLGTRDGYERPPQVSASQDTRPVYPETEVIDDSTDDDTTDDDITDHVEEDSASAQALAAMKLAEPEFSVGDFLQGARDAYEMILMSFERGDIDGIAPLLDDEVYQTFVDVVGEREDQGLTIDAKFVGLREVTLTEAVFYRTRGEAQITIRFVSEMIGVVRNAAGEIVEGDPNEIRRQKDSWTFMRKMGEKDPNWRLIATAE